MAPPKKSVKKKNPIGVAFGMLGASKGGKARAKKLSPKERSRIARLAANARWTEK
jgi:hypothetical protein